MAQKKKKEKVIAAGKAPAPAKAPKESIAATKGTIRKAKKTTPSRGPLAAERVNAILKALDEAYPEAVCALNHRTPWELLVATILSAQCTDVRVNMVTPELFRRFPTPAAMAKASLPELEGLIGPRDSSAIRRNQFRALRARSLPTSAVRCRRRSPS